MRLPHAALLLALLPLAACRAPVGAAPKDAPREAAAADANKAQDPNKAPKPGPSLDPSRRPEAMAEAASLPELLARTRGELEAERAKTRRLDQQLIESQSQIADLRKQSALKGQELGQLRGEREKYQAKLRELQERLVTAALRIAEAEKSALEARIAYEKAAATAADSGVVLDPKDTPGASSRPAPAGEAHP